MAHGPYGGFIGIIKSILVILHCVYYFCPNYILYELFVRKKPLDMTRIKKRLAEVAVVTGANRGVGAAVVKKLLELEMHVIAGVRNVEQMQKVHDEIRASGVKTGHLQIFKLDLSHFSSVREFANEIHKTNQPVRVLINNAGIMAIPYKLTVDGFETQFQVNYLGPFLLTSLLLPQLKKASRDSEDGVIVDVSSVAQYVGSLNFENLNGEKWYNNVQKYYDSKLAQTCSSHFLGTKLKQRGVKVRVNSLHPGFLGTGLWDSCWWYFGPLRWLFSLFTGTSENGADDIVYAAFDPDTQDITASYFYNREVDPKVPKVSWETMEKLWVLSCDMVKVPDFISQDPEKEPNILKSLNINMDDAIQVENIGTLLHQYFIHTANAVRPAEIEVRPPAPDLDIIKLV